MDLHPNLTIIEVMRTFPASIDVLEDAGIDYCCRGKQSIAEAARAAGFEASELIALLSPAADRGRHSLQEQSLADLTRFLIDDHQTLTEIGTSVESTAIGIETIDRVHASLLRRFRTLVGRLVGELKDHGGREEREIFPMVRQLEGANRFHAKEPPNRRIAPRVLTEFVEHETFHDGARTLRNLLNQLPALPELNALLLRFARQLHYHIHLENNVLYPAAADIENSLRR
jgi:regulator of cell morphogenesis and NO signaling